MLYLINFTDPNDKDIQMDLIIETPLSKKVVEQTIERILEKSKEIWNKDAYATLDEILAEEIAKEFKMLDYEFITFPW
ncbi:hypothetical protein M2349_000343 [Caldanaerobacter subterraneus subsp. tengcongensis MB4]|uniref:Uncharacterized protein n=1 Tax=Caldanaerobacter subterraneus subsp. tengcongensis (strain DSM 15242 / JCM 11007 / NBRC 100824 / MB4) TaxID=273068 RepID=Q8R8H7_CALS4|nr:hypothetical protein [Caldanaerobacter subterraneus]AAM25199.1 hypothetical protein TTE2022 [Caldanaerobacter subterraneus subsp. tengcongensis MB4]MCS3915202.1 hypothetical protein [Caldanaerobacter subterraneus subsp. tengcongensis MB4]